MAVFKADCNYSLECLFFMCKCALGVRGSGDIVLYVPSGVDAIL